MEHIGGYALAIDMTARGIQSEAKNKGLPWTVAKGYDTFCPISRFIEKSELPTPENTTLWLKVDDELRQHGSTSDMIFSIPFLVSHISSIMTLEEGDLILTGTPAGVGPVKPGQRLTAGIDGLQLEMSFPVVERLPSS
jgi:acylpyruvate hydrolase